MGSNQHGKGRTPSFGRSVALYAGFVLALAVIAVLSTVTGGPMAQDASVAHAGILTKDEARIEAPRNDPSLPSATEALNRPAPASPVEAVAPTF